MGEVYEFEGVIEAGRGGGAYIPVPLDVKQAFGGGRSTRVTATFDGFETKSNVVSMGGRFVLGIHKATRASIGKDSGDRVRVSLVGDPSPRAIKMPPELAEQLARHPDLSARFDALAYTYRKEFARWVSEAKRRETRDRRAGQTIEKLRDGETL